MTVKRTHAIVIGGSMGGMMAARILSNHFEHVTIIERDRLPDEAAYRAGTPQVRHLHALLAEGQRIMDDLFPGLSDDLTATGAPEICWGWDTRMITTGGPTPRFRSDVVTNLTSRTSLEHLVRQRIRQMDNITIHEQTQVEHLLSTPDRSQVTGVQVTHRRNRESRQLLADLVVDVSGRGSKAPAWLEALGYDAPGETRVNAKLGYATRWYRIPESLRDRDYHSIAIQANPAEGNYRGGGAFFVEDDRIVVTLTGSNADYPPTDEADFLAFAKSLSSPMIYDIIRQAEPISPIYGYRRTENRLRHYDRLARHPENFIAMGDSVCAFNPLYGQGMTVAAMEAVALDELLQQFNGQSLMGFATRFQKRLTRVIRTTWELATAEDLRYPETEGDEPGLKIRFMQWYTDQVAFAMAYDKQVCRAFIRVMNLQRQSEHLTRPDILARIIWHRLRHGRDDVQQTTSTQPVQQVRV